MKRIFLFTILAMLLFISCGGGPIEIVTETATETWKGLYAIFGEDDRAVETANNIAKIARNEEGVMQVVNSLCI